MLAARASTRAAQLSKAGSGVKTSKDLSEPTKWVMSDLSQFTQIMKEVERELEKWRAEKATCVSYLRELESDMLKGTSGRPPLRSSVVDSEPCVYRDHAEGGDRAFQQGVEGY